MLGFGWTYTQREVCVRFWVDLYTDGSLCLVLGGLIHRGKLMLGFGWTYTQRKVCVRLWVDLYTEGSLC